MRRTLWCVLGCQQSKHVSPVCPHMLHIAMHRLRKPGGSIGHPRFDSHVTHLFRALHVAKQCAAQLYHFGVHK